VWSRKTGKPLARAIVWDDSRTRGIVMHFENLLESQGIEIDGKVRRGKDGALGIKEL
jgi:glycerol kinase